MRLWSLHKPDFSLTCGRVDHTKSEYYQNTPGVPEAYEELWKLIGIPEGQIVWCFTCRDEIKPEVPKVLWELEVPEKEIVRFVDDIVWNRILGIRCALPTRLRQCFHREAIETFPDNPSKRNDYREKKVDAFWRKDAPTGNWWDLLFVQKSCEGASAIVRHPLRHGWVVHK